MRTEVDTSDVWLTGPSPSAKLPRWLASRSSVQLLGIVLAATLLSLPCWWFGLPAGTNAPTHVKYQHHFSRQFWNGETYPRWLAEENKGYGSPIFLVQYPLPYFVTALLRPFTSFRADGRESRELGLFVSLALAAAGLAAWCWLRRFTHPLAATLAAVVYVSLPFLLEDGIYARSAIGELCTFIWMPLALSLCETMYKRRSAVFLLSGVFALFVLSNLLATVLFAPLLTIYAIVFGRRLEPSIARRFLLVFVAQFLGAGMAAAYLLPALAYRRLFDLHQMGIVLPGYQFGLYFLNLTLGNLNSRVIDLALVGAVLFAGAAAWYIWRSVADARIRVCLSLALLLGALTLVPNLGATIIRLSGFELRRAPASDMMAMTLLAVFFTIALGLLAYCRIAGDDVGERGPLLLWVSLVSFFMMLPFSALIWRAIPGSSVIQFPFRLGGILCVAVTGLVALAFDSCIRNSRRSRFRPSSGVVALATFAAIAGGCCTWRADLAFRHPRVAEFDQTQDIDPMYRAYVPLEEMPAFARDMGTTPESYQAAPTAGDGTLRVGPVDADCDIHVTREDPRHLLVSSDCRAEKGLQVGQLYSPLWKVTGLAAASGNPVVSPSADGLMELTLGPGKQEAQVFFDTGAAGRWGAILTAASLLAGLIGFVFFHRRFGVGLTQKSGESLAAP
jgi:hypothetical protein